MDMNNLRRRDAYFEHELPDWAKYYFRDLSGLEWFAKSRRDELLEAGALVRFGRELLIDVSVFPDAAQAILLRGSVPGKLKVAA